MSMEDLYKRTLYTKKCKYLINEIHEYDIAKANISILLQNGYIDQNQFNMYLQMPKLQREIIIGNMQKDAYVSKMISNGFETARKNLIESNGLTEDDIVSIKKDAFYVTRRLHNTDFDKIHFTLRNSYHMYLYCCGIEIYYGMNELDESGDILDIKGIKDDKLPLHMSYLSMISYILKLVVRGKTEMALQQLLSFIQSYDSRELDITYYREFNSDSAYHIGQFGVTFIEDSYKDALNISYNQMFNRELFSILMSIHYKR